MFGTGDPRRDTRILILVLHARSSAKTGVLSGVSGSRRDVVDRLQREPGPALMETVQNGAQEKLGSCESIAGASRPRRNRCPGVGRRAGLRKPHARPEGRHGRPAPPRQQGARPDAPESPRLFRDANRTGDGEGLTLLPSGASKRVEPTRPKIAGCGRPLRLPLIVRQTGGRRLKRAAHVRKAVRASRTAPPKGGRNDA